MQIVDKEIKYDDVISRLTMDSQLPESDIEAIEDYVNYLKSEIDELQCELNNAEGEIEDLQSEVEDLQDEIDEEKDYQNQNLIQSIKEIVDDDWKYITKTYDTREKIIDRLDYLIRYGA